LIIKKKEIDVVAGINRKDPKAFEYLYDRYYAALCTYVSNLLNTEEDDGEDLVQELFVSIYEGNREFSNNNELTNYLYRACYNNCLLYIRDHQIHDSILNSLLENQHEEDDDEIYALTVREELFRQLYVYINELPQEQQKIMLLRIEGYEWNEIAEKLDISINTVKTQRSRSFKFLREHLEYSSFSILLFIL